VPDNSTAAVPSIDPVTATDEERLAWVQARAAAGPWDLALSSVIQDMRLMGIPLKQDLVLLGMGAAMAGGERGTRDFIDGLSLDSVDREACDG
jgi:hypothetical protein